MTQVFINGKFTAQRTTGVQRHAASLVQALDRRLADGAAPGGLAFVLLRPPGGVAPVLRHIESRVLGSRVAGLHGWEQFALPRAARHGLLLNLAGSAPAWAGRQVATLHDAALFDHPEAYAAAFRLWYRWLFARLGRQALALLTVSEFSRQRLSAALQLAPGRFIVVPGAANHLEQAVADPDALAHFGLAGQRFLLAVGSANPTKNLPALLRAYRALPAGHGALLVIAGGLAGQVFATRGGEPDPPGVRRLGPVGDSALKALYQQAQALVFPSIYEGFGLPPLEAMACGCPVAVARAASLPAVCGEAALYFDPRDEAAMSKVLAQLLDDSALRKRLRAAGQARAAAWRWESSTERLLDVLAEVGAAPMGAARCRA
jgi:glycosyltransferase involved in cell wall biosynthesis